MRSLLLLGTFMLATACQVVNLAYTPQATTPHSLSGVNTITPRPSATHPPTATPSPTATQTPPKRYFVEEFESIPVHWATLFASGDTPEVDIFNDNGSLTFELYEPVTWLYAIYGAFEYDQVHLETEVRSHGSDQNAMGLVCGYDEQEGWFEFNISSEGTYNVLYGQWLAEGIAQYTSILEDLSDRIEQGDATNEIGLDCMDTDLRLYINGKLIRKIDVSRYELSGGKIGLSVACFEEIPVLLAFEWVKVREIDTE